jgi:hypothetical protein
LIRTVLRNDQWERIAPELPGKAGDHGITARDNRLLVNRRPTFCMPNNIEPLRIRGRERTRSRKPAYAAKARLPNERLVGFGCLSVPTKPTAAFLRHASKMLGP